MFPKKILAQPHNHYNFEIDSEEKCEFFSIGSLDNINEQTIQYRNQKG